MAEIGLVQFAGVAHASVPRYRTTFSKHQFAQPQLPAILCLVRYEDWTYCEAEVRWREHIELRVPRILVRFLTTLPCIASCVVSTRPPSLARSTRLCKACRSAGRRRRTPVAVDATGLSPGAISTFSCAACTITTSNPCLGATG